MTMRITALVATLLCSSWLAFVASAQDTQPSPTPQATPPTSAEPEETEPPADTPRRHRREIVHFNSNAYLGADESANELVAIGGNATSEGEVRNEVVAVFGKTHVTGEANEAVAVFGDVYVDGRVGREVVAIVGNVTLGPNAVIEGDVRAFLGTVTADPAAKIEGDIEQVSAPWVQSTVYQPWFKQGLLLARPLALEPGFGWAWRLAMFFLVLYVIIALLLPRQMKDAAETFTEHPGEVVLSSFLSVFLIPLLGFALIATFVGIALLPFYWLGLLVGVWFGKAAVLAAIGRQVTRFLPEGPLAHVAVAVAIGSLVICAVYVVPVLGFISFIVLGLLGQGLLAYVLVRGLRDWQQRRSNNGPRVDLRKPDPNVPPAAPAPGDTAAPDVAMDADSYLTLPRAGFWIRMAALFVDAVIVLVAVNVVASGAGPLALAGYGALMWKIKGTTIGGTLCNLQVVRADGREMDWPTALVRALSCFLSALFIGLGFFWIAFDRDRQAWHDKIAGTVVVRTARTVALV